MLAVEVSQDYALILPLMVVVVLSVAVTQLLMRETIYSEGLKRIGIEVSSAGASERLAALRVESMMEPARCVLSPEMTLDEARLAFTRSQVDLAPVVLVSDGTVAGMLSSRDLVTSITQSSGEQEPTVGDVMTQPAIVIRQDESVRAAAQLMERADIRALAVVDKAGGIVGVIGRGKCPRELYTRIDTRAAAEYRTAGRGHRPCARAARESTRRSDARQPRLSIRQPCGERTASRDNLCAAWVASASGGRQAGRARGACRSR
jgi:CBS domain-containing protein